MSKKAVVAGHICLDVTPVFPGKKMKVLDDILMPGKLISMDGIDIHTGGCVANTGLAMKKLGADVKLLGKIGHDEFGRLILDIMEENKYDGKRDMIQAEDNHTSYSIVLAIPGIDRIFLHDPGANNTFCYDDIDFESIKDMNHFHFGYPSIMKKIYENDGADLIRIFKKVKEYGMSTSLDLAAVDPNSEAGMVDWKKVLTKVIPYVDFFVPSIEELCCMLQPETYQEWMKKADGGDITDLLSMENDIEPLADELMGMGAKFILIKCGRPGIYYRSASADKIAMVGKKAELDLEKWANLHGFEKSYQPDEIRSGTGAGDTSIAAFLTAMLSGREPGRCIQLAAATGACCVSAYDALSGLKPFEELESRIEKGWKKI
ncbi:MAG: carbohydrate kinase family protein [Lachnospiraceae bacterium]|nr:carbohydrate kinase family protein [Lachnospiraceae bacterium]MDD3659550.1 carbohydrate kinase family protein [Lachnospiraceae bacterium]